MKHITTKNMTVKAQLFQDFVNYFRINIAIYTFEERFYLVLKEFKY
jgi:hypothetical protein